MKATMPRMMLETIAGIKGVERFAMLLLNADWIDASKEKCLESRASASVFMRARIFRNLLIVAINLNAFTTA
jgi:hypothetical protein